MSDESETALLFISYTSIRIRIRIKLGRRIGVKPATPYGEKEGERERV